MNQADGGVAAFVQIEIWSDVVCPWCYLGKRRFEAALEQFEHRDEVEVTYRSFELDPAAPTGPGGLTIDMLSTKYGMTRERAEDLQREMEQRAAGDGLTFRLAGQRTGNTRDAHRLLHLAKQHGVQAELAERLHRAHFSDQESVFDRPALVGYGVEVGLNRDEVERVLAGDEFVQDVLADEATARELGANGVPFFVIDRKYGISGAQSADVIAAALNRAWAEQHPRVDQ